MAVCYRWRGSLLPMAGIKGISDFLLPMSFCYRCLLLPLAWYPLASFQNSALIFLRNTLLHATSRYGTQMVFISIPAPGYSMWHFLAQHSTAESSVCLNLNSHWYRIQLANAAIYRITRTHSWKRMSEQLNAKWTFVYFSETVYNLNLSIHNPRIYYILTFIFS